jgi:uncharacterized membrane protein YqhA
MTFSKLFSLSARLMVVAVVALWVASMATLFWGVMKTVKVVGVIAGQISDDDTVPYYLIGVVDAFLLAIVLFTFAASIYELFIGKLELPDWIPAHNLNELKSKLGSLVILVLAIDFLGRVLKDDEPLSLLWMGLAISVVSATLVLFNWLGDKTKKSKDNGPAFADEYTT